MSVKHYIVLPLRQGRHFPSSC